MRFDIVVIGAGMAGASAAYELSELGSVALIEREDQPGYHTTGRSAAVYLKSYGNEVIKAVTAASEAFFRSPPQGFSESDLLSDRGSIFIAREDQLDKLEQELALFQPFVPSARILSADEVMQLVPELRGNYVAGGLLDPVAEDMDVDAILQGYLRGFRARNGKLITDAGLTGLRREHSSWHLDTKAGPIVCDIVVNAAGAWGDQVAQLAGLDPVGLIPKRRTAFIVAPPEGANISQWPVVADIDEQFYFRPESGGLFCSPADETPSEPCDAQPEELDIAIAADRIMKALTIDIHHIRKSWAGLRTFAPDKTPVLGYDQRQPGFFWLVGQGGYGIQTAPAMAKLTRTLIDNGDQDIVAPKIVKAMSPDRFMN